MSEDARRTLVEHLGGDAVLIPNGVFVDRFASARAAGRSGAAPAAPSASSAGWTSRARGCRRCWPRWPRSSRRGPASGCSSPGRGDEEEARRGPAARRCARAVTFLGVVSEEDKARLLRTVDVYVAPNLGGESFGIILVEAMSAGAPVLATDLDAFRRVLDDGRVGALFPDRRHRRPGPDAARPAGDDAGRAPAVGGRVGLGAPLRLGDGRRRAARGLRDGRRPARARVAEDVGRPWRDRLRR